MSTNTIIKQDMLSRLSEKLDNVLCDYEEIRSLLNTVINYNIPVCDQNDDSRITEFLYSIKVIEKTIKANNEELSDCIVSIMKEKKYLK